MPCLGVCPHLSLCNQSELFVTVFLSHYLPTVFCCVLLAWPWSCLFVKIITDSLEIGCVAVYYIEVLNRLLAKWIFQIIKVLLLFAVSMTRKRKLTWNYNASLVEMGQSKITTGELYNWHLYNCEKLNYYVQQEIMYSTNPVHHNILNVLKLKEEK